MTMLHILHNNHQQTHYDCRLGWKIDAASRTLVIHKRGGRWHIPLDNVVSIEVAYTPIPEARAMTTIPTSAFDELVDDLEHFKEWSNTIADRMTEDYDGEDALEYRIDIWLTDIEQRMHDNDPEAWARFFSGRHTAQKNTKGDGGDGGDGLSRYLHD